ncbi:MAG: hypothetical protein WHW07_03690 [Bacteroidales bacterium]|jgi:hypothetical protein|nr:hypothetical protein [Bacteroidales bacterium]HOL97511.1 hypothetical protein [Bacteroidales bacterium]HOM35779.1 hypothetical protein [Bacteroidales bacterium]HPD23003.1 hypothetical protein [Bacteroidales bacterium]HRS98842.1 hypothetical protein [Bacteroidales bacterium]
MLLQTKEDHIDFLNKRIIETVSKLLNQNENVLTVMISAQAIEVLGAYLDDKPMRAKGLSAKRFELALYKLFPKKYAEVNTKSFLYSQMRACLTHMFIPTSSLLIVGNQDSEYYKHLEIENETIVIKVEELYKDLINATNKVKKLLFEGKIRPKKISISSRY